MYHTYSIYVTIHVRFVTAIVKGFGKFRVRNLNFIEVGV